MPLDWMSLASGQKFYPLEPKKTLYTIDDIAHSLSLQCRFNGHTKRFYSVAEHSIHIARWLQREGHNRFVVRTGLLHDATEAYLGDLVVCIKHLLPDYKKFEESLNQCFVDAFGMQHPFPDIVKEADQRILVDEKKALMNSKDVWPCDDWSPLGVKIEGWPPHRAEYEFKEVYRQTASYEPVS